jgi:hypothetical protein
LELGEDGSNGGCIARANGDQGRKEPVGGDGSGGGSGVLWNLATPGRRYRVFEAAPQGTRGMPAKKPVGEYFL